MNSLVATDELVIRKGWKVLQYIRDTSPEQFVSKLELTRTKLGTRVILIEFEEAIP